MTCPILHTERLTLRAPKLADFEHWAAFFGSPRADHERGQKDRAEAYRYWAADVALWQLRGYGPFSLDDRATGAYVGEVGIYQPEGYPEREIGWFTIPDAEGKGYAFEAASAVIGWARESFGWDRLVSYIDPRNTRSVALAKRLGAVIDPSLDGTEPGDIVLRHDLRQDCGARA
ncbi:GNAT family N-acetyltransferase [Defluviimonas sp. WL0002]|uniref:GNAT family N-acetyltransferase n=1 Tax=Albidovulum marisflavi TaxID=2984159 RepID=A0ABT2Z9S4_9RHOB|nr:GNAT family N-acetyltransferase [Defluviimonas sp. WL0002]MCV2867787.1 GNAT family N-acetyltransferase [Defluviimonas sp. WL0002]